MFSQSHNEMKLAIAVIALDRLLDAIEEWHEAPYDELDYQLYEFAQEIRESMDKHEAWPRDDVSV